MIQKSPFKFLDSFTKDDRDIFFGRDREIEELHSRVFESKILLVYGTSGTGKSSLINCGLANKLSDSDWMPVNIRRGTDINRSLFEALSKVAMTKTPFEKAGASGRSYNLERLLRSVWLDHFKPVFLIFDQFEELFIFGRKDEKDELIGNIAKVVDSEIQCRFIFAMREEYLAGITEFEREIPSFLANRIRIEKMTRQNATHTIEGPCRVNNIDVEPGFSEALLEKLNPDTPEVELTWLQIFLDKIMRFAEGENQIVNRFSLYLLAKAGEVKDILGTFLEEQISQLDDPDTGLVVLKSFVSVKGTKHQITEDEVIEYSGTFGKKVDSEVIRELIQKFIKLRILRDKDEEGRYELRHDSLATKIYEKITLVEKELLEVKYFIENAYVNYERRHLLLSDEDLKYIAPYEDKLFLNEKSLRFIEQSKQALQKARRRRQNIVLAAASIIIVVMSFFTIWAMRERGNALTQQRIAEDQKNAAVEAKEEADAARQEAVISRHRADSSAVVAISAMNQSEIARKEAVAARVSAEQQRTRAEQMSVIAGEQARRAELERQAADTQRILALAAEEKAKRLSMLSLAQTLALRAMSQEFKPEAMGLTAVQAYNFNKNNGGQFDDPVIFKALDKAYNILDSSKHSIIKFASSTEMHSLAEDENGLLSADMNGDFWNWSIAKEQYMFFKKNQWQWGLHRNMILRDYIDFISLSPGGDKLIMHWENNMLILRRIITKPKFIQEDTEIQGHIGSISAATWSNDGNYLATGGIDSLIMIWDTGLESANSIRKLKAQSAIRALSLCGTDTIISVQDDGSIILWNIQNSSSEILLSRGIEQPLCVAWNRSKKTVMAGCSNGIILLIDLKNVPYELSRFTAHSAGIDQIVFSKDFSLMATAGWDKIVKLYNYHEFFEMSNSVGGAINFDNLNARARSLMLTADKLLVAGMSDRTIRVWETSSQKLVSLICGLVNRDMTALEWADIVGKEMPYEKTCGRRP
jgi:hypothetical protein